MMRSNLLLKLTLTIMLLCIPLIIALAGSEAPPELLLADRAGFHPEGVVWDMLNRRFLTGSMTEGTIFVIADDSTVTPFIEDEDLKTTLGIDIDYGNNHLLVANTEMSQDPDSTGLAQLGIYDLTSGERLHLVDLGLLLAEGHHLANGVAVDADGNTYVTDSFSPVIYKVTPDGAASIFAEAPEFASETFGLNGIACHRDDYLLVAQTEPGALYKVPLDDPETITRIEVGEPFSPDGIAFDTDGALFVVATTFGDDGSPKGEILKLATENEWESAEIVSRVAVDADLSPTSITFRDGYPYVINAHLNELFSGQSVDKFEITRIDFAGS